jgi:HlyD family secretion protein
MEENFDKSEIRQTYEDIDDFIGNPPGWILHSGITLIAFVVVIILTATAFIRYPDKINGKGILTGTMPPIEHFAKTDGIIDSIYITTGQKITTGQELVYIRNLTNRDHLHQWLDFIRKYESVGHIPDYLRLTFPENLSLGEMQSEYGNMQLSFSAFQATLRQSGVFQQISTISDEINKTHQLSQVLDKDKDLSAEELQLIEKDYGRFESLRKDGVVSDLDKEKSKGELLRYQKQYNNTSQSIIQNKIRQNQLQLEIQRLSEDRSGKINEHLMRMREIITISHQKIQAWSEIYYITAKTEGTVQITEGLVSGKYIRPSDILATIIHDGEKNERYILTKLLAEGFSKIVQGGDAVVRFDGWPYKEYGILLSHVTYISAVPAPDQKGTFYYDIKVYLPDSIITTYDHVIPYKPQSTVTVDFITEDKSILYRIFDNFLNLIKN